MTSRTPIPLFAALLTAACSSSPGAAPLSDGGSTPDATTGDAGPHRVTACPSVDAGLTGAAAWSNVTPTQVSLAEDAATGAGQNYGTNAFVLDPTDTATIYLGTSGQGIYKSTDCGATWTHINTGRNGKTLDKGRQWTMAIDPTNPQVLYANSGYGPENGIFKSTNGGVDWDQLLPPGVGANFIFGGFVGGIAMDPTNHEHLVLWPHFNCCDDAGTCNQDCVLESENAGGSWTRIDVDGGASGEGYGFMIVPDPSSPTNSKHWFLAETYGGLYETKDEGATWALVANQQGYAYPTIYAAPNGDYFVPAAFDVIQSTNAGDAWSTIDKSPGVDVITGNGTTLYAAHGGCTTVTDPFQPIYTASTTTPGKWEQLPPTMVAGPGYLTYDEDHHLLYASSCLGGFWRGVVP